MSLSFEENSSLITEHRTEVWAQSTRPNIITLIYLLPFNTSMLL